MDILIVGNNTDDFVGIRGELLNAMSEHGHHLSLCGPAPHEHETLKKIASLNAKFVQISLSPLSFNPIKDMVAAYEIFSCVRHAKPDMVLLLTIKPIMYGSIAARIGGAHRIYSLNSGIGRIFSFRTIKEKILFQILRPLLILAFRFNTKAFFQNHDDIELYVNKGIIKLNKTVRVNGTGVDLNRFKYRYNKLSGVIKIVMISRLLKEKGVDYYCEAAKQILEKYPEKVSFSLVGNFDGTKDGITQSELNKLIGDHVSYLGGTNDVRPFLIDHNIFILPSYYREGVPRIIMEAMAVGMPIITTDAPGCRDTVNGKNGILVTAKDTDSLYQAIEFFIENVDEIEKMSVEGRQFVELKFDINQVNYRMLSVMGLI